MHLSGSNLEQKCPDFDRIRVTGSLTTNFLFLWILLYIVNVKYFRCFFEG